MSAFAAPGQTAHSCRAIAENCHDTAYKMEAAALGMRPDFAAKQLRLAMGFRKSAAEWDALAGKLEREAIAA